ncbi:MAG: DUF1670 domain-containing protein [Candidatus Micrarchaeota archaeon]
MQKKKEAQEVKEIQVEIYLDDEDIKILNAEGLDKLRQRIIEKYAYSFYDAKQPLTLQDLAFFLHTDVKTIEDDVQEIENAKGVVLPINGLKTWPENNNKNEVIELVDVKNKPVKAFKAGGIQSSIFKHVRQAQSGENAAFISYNAQITKQFYDKNSEEWKGTTNFDANDLPKLILVAQKSYDYMVSEDKR